MLMQLQGSCETALLAASGAACLADASQPARDTQASFACVHEWGKHSVALQ